MRLSARKLLVLGAPGLLAVVLASCGGSDTAGSGGGSTLPGNPQVVNPSSVGGTPGKGALIVPNPSGPISLPDRALTIVNAIKLYSSTRHATLVDVTLTISNPAGGATINNQPKFFAIVVSGGDVFYHQDNSSDTFYGPIPPNTSRTGLIEFEIPSPKVTGIQLLYRPDVPGDEVLARLPVP